MKYIILTLMIVSTVTANLLMKLGATQSIGIVGMFLNYKTLIGLIMFAIAAFLYTYLLSLMPLNIAQSFASIQYIGVILCATLFLGESISWQQIFGIATIAFGVFIVGFFS